MHQLWVSKRIKLIKKKRKTLFKELASKDKEICDLGNTEFNTVVLKKLNQMPKKQTSSLMNSEKKNPLAKNNILINKLKL